MTLDSSEEAFGRVLNPVAQELRQAAQDRRLIADSRLDEGWMRTLRTAAGRTHYPPVEHIDALVDRLRLDDDEVKACVALVDRQAFPRHRAGYDARWLATLNAR